MFLDDRRDLAFHGRVPAAHPVDVGAPPLAVTGVVVEIRIGRISTLTASPRKNFTAYTRAWRAWRAWRASVGEIRVCNLG
jgi:hypothetical protein